MNVDPYGRVICNNDDIFNALYRGETIENLIVEDNWEFRELIRLVEENDLPAKLPTINQPPLRTPEEEHKQRRDTWFIPEPYREIDVRSFVLALCLNNEQKDRATMELDLFESRDMFPVLQLMIYLSQYFEEKNIITGCGRGSSVASYVLFLIGIHHIDSLKYNLDIGEFLR